MTPATLTKLSQLLHDLPNEDLDPLKIANLVRRELQSRTVVMEEQPDGSWKGRRLILSAEKPEKPP